MTAEMRICNPKDSHSPPVFLNLMQGPDSRGTVHFNNYCDEQVMLLLSSFLSLTPTRLSGRNYQPISARCSVKWQTPKSASGEHAPSIHNQTLPFHSSYKCYVILGNIFVRWNPPCRHAYIALMMKFSVPYRKINCCKKKASLTAGRSCCSVIGAIPRRWRISTI
jgi:hypothetical protein